MKYLVRTYPALIPLIVPSYRVSSRFLSLLYGIAEVSTVYSYSSLIGQLDHAYSRKKIKFGLTFAGNQQKKVAYKVGQYGSMKTFVRPQILLIDSRRSFGCFLGICNQVNRISIRLRR